MWRKVSTGQTIQATLKTDSRSLVGSLIGGCHVGVPAWGLTPPECKHEFVLPETQLAATAAVAETAVPVERVSGAASRQLVVPHCWCYPAGRVVQVEPPLDSWWCPTAAGFPAGRVDTPASPGRPPREGEAGHRCCVPTAVPRYPP
jgi:hypothetical protein